VTLDHKTSHKCQFFRITLSESWINKLFIDVWFVRIGHYLAEMQLFENLESGKFKFWYIYSCKFTKYLHGTWFFLNILMIFGIKEKSISLHQTVYLWLLLQIYPRDFRLVLCSRVSYETEFLNPLKNVWCMSNLLFKESKWCVLKFTLYCHKHTEEWKRCLGFWMDMCVIIMCFDCAIFQLTGFICSWNFRNRKCNCTNCTMYC